MLLTCNSLVGHTKPFQRPAGLLDVPAFLTSQWIAQAVAGVGGLMVIHTEAERFWKHVKIADSGCWEWQAATNYGYGVFSVGRLFRKTIQAHRWAYENYVGPVPQGSHLHHTCWNRACVNPIHLKPLTPREHVRMSARATARFCKRGHPLEGANCRMYQGKRCCRACLNLWQKVNNRQINGHTLSSAAIAQWRRLSPDQRTERALRGWDTRRRMARLQAPLPDHDL